MDSYQYELYPLPNLSDLPELINSIPDLCGLNVTVPHKIGVMFYLDKVDPAAKEIDAVNCIKIVNHQPVEAFSMVNFRLCRLGLKVIIQMPTLLKNP